MKSGRSLDTTRSLLVETAIRGSLGVALFVAFPPFSDVYRLWLRQAGELAGFPDVFEYQPLSALWVQAIYPLPNATFAVAVNGMAMVLAAMVVTYVLAESAPKASAPAADIRMWVASPALLLLLPINWDVLVVAMAVVSVLALYKSREVVAGVMAGAGTALKLVPGFLVLPVLPVIAGLRRRLLFLGAGLLGLGVPYVISASTDSDWRYHLEFASERSDIGATIWGLIRDVGELLGWSVRIDTINIISSGVLVLALVAVTIWSARTMPGFSRVSALAIVAALLFVKVFKPQYVLWLLPFLAWTGADRGRVRLLEIVVLVEFATIYFALPESVLIPITTVLRIVLLAVLGWGLLKESEVSVSGRAQSSSTRP